MRWDLRRPEKRFTDRFILVAGHTNPLVYAALAALSDVLRIKFKVSSDENYLIRNEAKRALYPEDLITLRNRDGLPGHAEMIDKTLFFMFNTGPSGHGSPASAGAGRAIEKIRDENSLITYI